MAVNEHIPPHPCDLCKRIKRTGGCPKAKGCELWLAWFNAEWRAIREAARREKER